MVLPALALVAKPITCSLADAYVIHKQILVGALTTFMLSFGSLGILPFIKDRENHDTDFMTWICICILCCIGYVSTACIFCMTDALASNYARKHNKSYSRMRIWAPTGWGCGALLIMMVGELGLPSRVAGCLVLTVSTLANIAILLLWPYPEDFEMFHDGSSYEQRKLSIVGPNTIALMAKNKPRKSISHDMLVKIRAGRSKSVGGLPKIQETFNIQNDQLKGDTKEKEPKEYSNFQCQMILIKMIASEHKSFIRYIILFTLYGVIQAMVWNFSLDFFRERVVKDNAEFEFISTLSLIAQSICGETIVNIFASDLLRIVGTNASMSLALVSIGLRCYFYGNLLPYIGSYSVILSEILQGPSLALYWILIVDVGSNYALMVTDYMPEMKRRGIVRDRVHEEELNGCLRASMIGVMSSSMEGLGIVMGSLLGGLLSSSMGYDFMWNLCAIIGFTAGFANIGWELATKLIFKKEKVNKEILQEKIPTIVVQDSVLKLERGSKL